LKYNFCELLVNDSEFNNFTGTQPIPCRWCIYLALSLARAAAAAVAAADFCCCCAPPPHPAPFILGEGSTKKLKSSVASAVAVVHVGVCVGVVGVTFVESWSRCVEV
jgi:hypothetical protein